MLGRHATATTAFEFVPHDHAALAAAAVPVRMGTIVVFVRAAPIIMVQMATSDG